MQRDNLEAEIEKLQNELNNDSGLKELEEARAKLEEQESENNRLQIKIQEYENQVKSTLDASEQHGKTVGNLDTRIKDLESELNNTRTQLAEMLSIMKIKDLSWEEQKDKLRQYITYLAQ